MNTFREFPPKISVFGLRMLREEDGSREYLGVGFRRREGGICASFGRGSAIRVGRIAGRDTLYGVSPVLGWSYEFRSAPGINITWLVRHSRVCHPRELSRQEREDFVSALCEETRSQGIYLLKPLT